MGDKRYKLKKYSNSELEELRVGIRAYFRSKGYEEKIPTSENFFEDFAKEINTHFVKISGLKDSGEDIITSRYIRDLFGSYDNYEKKNVKMVEAIIGYLNYLQLNNPDSEVSQSESKLPVEVGSTDDKYETNANTPNDGASDTLSHPSGDQNNTDVPPTTTKKRKQNVFLKVSLVLGSCFVLIATLLYFAWDKPEYAAYIVPVKEVIAKAAGDTATSVQGKEYHVQLDDNEVQGNFSSQLNNGESLTDTASSLSNSPDSLQVRRATALLYNLISQPLNKANLALMNDCIDRGAHCNIVAENGVTPILVAAMFNDTALARKILAIPSINLNVRDLSVYGTPIWWASKKNSYEVAKMILDYGGNAVDVNARAQSIRGNYSTPLDCAKDVRMKHLLWEYNAQTYQYYLDHKDK